MKRQLILTLLLAACGDNRVPAQPDAHTEIADATPADAPVQTWGDAWEVWANAWCRLAARCDPEEFAAYYPGGHAACVVDITAQNCAITSDHACSDPYDRIRLRALAQCEADMDDLACGADQAPDSCFEAFW